MAVLSPVYCVILCILWVGNSDLGTGPLQPADGCGSEICPEAQRGDGWCPELGVAGKGALTSVGVCKPSSAAPGPGDHPPGGVFLGRAWQAVWVPQSPVPPCRSSLSCPVACPSSGQRVDPLAAVQEGWGLTQMEPAPCRCLRDAPSTPGGGGRRRRGFRAGRQGAAVRPGPGQGETAPRPRPRPCTLCSVDIRDRGVGLQGCGAVGQLVGRPGCPGCPFLCSGPAELGPGAPPAVDDGPAHLGVWACGELEAGVGRPELWALDQNDSKAPIAVAARSLLGRQSLAGAVLSGQTPGWAGTVLG